MHTLWQDPPQAVRGFDDPELRDHHYARWETRLRCWTLFLCVLGAAVLGMVLFILVFCASTLPTGGH